MEHPPIDIANVARRHGFSREGAEHVLRSLSATDGSAAQFNHPDLGGLGQWMPGMTQVSDMFNAALRTRVDALCAELAAHVRASPSRARESRPADTWWPAALGEPNAAGGQGDVAYAWFAPAKRLALREAGTVTLYDTADHVITGVAQVQHSGGRRITFSTNAGPVQLELLRVVTS